MCIRDSFFEIVADIGSNNIANKITKLALGYAKTLTIEMMFLMEAATEDTLPEQILGGVQIKNADLKNKDAQRVTTSVDEATASDEN